MTDLAFFCFVLGAINFLMFTSCLKELEFFPDVVLTEATDVAMANFIRKLTIFFTGIAACYGFMALGQMLGMGGMERLATSQIQTLAIVISLLGSGLFFLSRNMDLTVYKSIAKYEGILYDDIQDLKEKIRNSDLIQERGKNRFDQLEKEKQRLNALLEELTEENYKKDQRIRQLEEELKAAQNTKEQLKKKKQASSKKIQLTELQISATDKEIELISKEVETLGKDLSNLEDSLAQKMEVLTPLVASFKDEKANLDRTSSEYNTVVDTISQIKADLSTTNKQEKKLAKKLAEAQANLASLETESEQAQRSIEEINDKFRRIQRQKENLNAIIKDFDIAELSLEEEEETLAILKRRVDKHFSENNEDGDRVFE